MDSLSTTQISSGMEPLSKKARRESEIYRLLSLLDEERKQMRRAGGKNTAEYKVMDRVAQALMDELSLQ